MHALVTAILALAKSRGYVTEAAVTPANEPAMYLCAGGKTLKKREHEITMFSNSNEISRCGARCTCTISWGISNANVIGQGHEYIRSESFMAHGVHIFDQIIMLNVTYSW